MILLFLITLYINSTFDKGIKVFKQANMSWKEAVEYDWATYDTQPAVLAFRELENEIKDRYTMLKVSFGFPLAPILPGTKPYIQAADQWPKALDILHKATAKDKERVEKMNERFKKVRLTVSVLLTPERLIVSSRSMRTSILPWMDSLSTSLSSRQLRMSAISRVRYHSGYTTSVPITYLSFSASLPHDASFRHPLQSLTPGRPRDSTQEDSQ